MFQYFKVQSFRMSFKVSSGLKVIYLFPVIIFDTLFQYC